MKRSAPGSHFPSFHGQMGIVSAHNAPSIWLFFPGIPEEWDGSVCVQLFQAGIPAGSLLPVPSLHPSGEDLPGYEKSWEILLEAGVAVWIFGISAPFPRDGGHWMDVTDRDVLGRASRGIRVELVVPKLFDPLRLFVCLDFPAVPGIPGRFGIRTQVFPWISAPVSEDMERRRN